ncbi:hypothetical protein GCM10010917_28170 [Paenibacillus physcomitrellae]|uniref:Uncharacterized protein n=1 Tax=Paenibacillus physcomitrellae TaxID=1619311 RepID=A0ABQ1GD22_9BACL|nr:hypothetical protein GCM10010917_28170 [Paenibacillus physcomitrellae]
MCANRLSEEAVFSLFIYAFGEIITRKEAKTTLHWRFCTYPWIPGFYNLKGQDPLPIKWEVIEA